MDLLESLSRAVRRKSQQLSLIFASSLENLRGQFNAEEFNNKEKDCEIPVSHNNDNQLNNSLTLSKSMSRDYITASSRINNNIVSPFIFELSKIRNSIKGDYLQNS